MLASALIPFAGFFHPPVTSNREYPSFLPPKLSLPLPPRFVCSSFTLFSSHRHYVPFAGWLRVSIATRHRGQTRERWLSTHISTPNRGGVGACVYPTCWAYCERSDPLKKKKKKRKEILRKTRGTGFFSSLSRGKNVEKLG